MKTYGIILWNYLHDDLGDSVSVNEIVEYADPISHAKICRSLEERGYDFRAVLIQDIRDDWRNVECLDS